MADVDRRRDLLDDEAGAARAARFAGAGLPLTARPATRWPESVQPPATSASAAIGTSALRLDVCGLGRGRGPGVALDLTLLGSRARLLGGRIDRRHIRRFPDSVTGSASASVAVGAASVAASARWAARCFASPGTLLLLADARLLADLAAQVVELRAVDVADRLHLDLLDLGRVQRERPLHADAERLLADGERLARRRRPGA